MSYRRISPILQTQMDLASGRTEAMMRERHENPQLQTSGVIKMNREMVQTMLDRIEGKITAEEFIERYLSGQQKSIEEEGYL